MKLINNTRTELKYTNILLFIFSYIRIRYTRIGMLKRIGEGVDPMDIGRSSTDLGDGLNGRAT